MLERLHLLPETRLLDAGCGSGLFAELAAQGGADVIGLDVAPGLVEYARRRRPAAGYVVEDLERMPFGDGAFDVVTAFNSVLYAADPRRALAEIARVTAPSGRAVVTVGAGPEQAESAALINPLAPHDEVPDRSTLDLADADAARGALLDAGFASVAMADIAFDVDFQRGRRGRRPAASRPGRRGGPALRPRGRRSGAAVLLRAPTTGRRDRAHGPRPPLLSRGAGAMTMSSVRAVRSYRMTTKPTRRESRS